MSRQKKSRKISDIMPTRKADKTAAMGNKSKNGKKLSRYELDTKAWEAKKKKKHKGLPSGNRHNTSDNNQSKVITEKKDPRLGSRKKVALVVEVVNKPEKGQFIQPVRLETPVKSQLELEKELTQLENNECLNQLLDQLEAGQKISKEDQRFVDECLDRIEQLMEQLGLNEEENSPEDLYQTFATIDINRFK